MMYGKKTLGEKIRAKQFKKSIKKIYDLCTYKDRACIDCDYSFHTECDGEVLYECKLTKWENGADRYPYEYNDL